MTDTLKELERLLAGLRAIVANYEKKNPLRTADFHSDGCVCYRCAVDACSAAVNALPELLAELERLREAGTEAFEYGLSVMRLLEREGGDIVPYLMDTDDNTGQRFRCALVRLAAALKGNSDD